MLDRRENPACSVVFFEEIADIGVPSIGGLGHTAPSRKDLSKYKLTSVSRVRVSSGDATIWLPFHLGADHR